MIVLLTGKPGIGKTTVIEKFISLNQQPANWVITSDIRNTAGERVGFMATNSTGQKRIISHKTDIESDSIIGKNHVDLLAVEVMFATTLSTSGDTKLTIVDEIGPIQLLSQTFKIALDSAFQDTSDIVATIHYKDDYLESYRSSPNALLLAVSKENRDILPPALIALTENRATFNKLTKQQRAKAYELLRLYAEGSQLLQIQKLANNAIHYVSNNQVSSGVDSWTVTGRHSQHKVMRNSAGHICDCDLFNGRRQYAESAGDCSHIQAVIIHASSQ